MYIKINTTINLNSGISIPSGSVVTIAEGYADIKSEKEGVIPAQVATFVFASEAAYQQGLEPVSGVADFNPVFGGLGLSVADYQTKTAEALLVAAVEGALIAIYGAENISVVNGQS